jgi:hypothetical protein
MCYYVLYEDQTGELIIVQIEFETYFEAQEYANKVGLEFAPIVARGLKKSLDRLLERV